MSLDQSSDDEISFPQAVDNDVFVHFTPEDRIAPAFGGCGRRNSS